MLVSVLVAWGLHSCGMMTNTQLSNQLGPRYEQWLGVFYKYEPSFFAALKSAFWESFFEYNPTTSYNCVLWTMEIELYGSLFLFGFLSLVGKHSARILFYIITVIVAYALNMHWVNAFVLGSITCDACVHSIAIRQRLPSFVVKVYGTLIHSHWLAVLIVLPLLYIIGLLNIHGVMHLVIATGLTAYVVLSTPEISLFSRSIPIFLGKISFGLYLVHLPVICAF